VPYGLNDGYLAYLTSLGYTDGTLADRERQFLDTTTGGAYPTATNQDLWGIVCTALGITDGTLDERIRQLMASTMINNLETYNDTQVAYFNFETGFTPRDLFAAGPYNGAWYDASATGTIYYKNDTTGEIRLAEIGEPVYQVLDRSGNGHHLVQTTVSKRPTYSMTSDGYYYLDFDGIDDCMITTDSVDYSADTQATFCFGLQRDTTSTADLFFDHDHGGTGAQATSLSCNAGAATLIGSIKNSGVYAFDSVALSAADPSVMTFLVDRTQATLATQMTMRKDGAVPTNTRSGTAVGAGTFFPNAPFYVGARNQTTNPLDGRIYQIVVVNGLLAGADLTNLETYINDKTGAY
jgi:hypothetical protein